MIGIAIVMGTFVLLSFLVGFAVGRMTVIPIQDDPVE